MVWSCQDRVIKIQNWIIIIRANPSTSTLFRTSDRVTERWLSSRWLDSDNIRLLLNKTLFHSLKTKAYLGHLISLSSYHFRSDLLCSTQPVNYILSPTFRTYFPFLSSLLTLNTLSFSLLASWWWRKLELELGSEDSRFGNRKYNQTRDIIMHICNQPSAPTKWKKKCEGTQNAM